MTLILLSNYRPCTKFSICPNKVLFISPKKVFSGSLSYPGSCISSCHISLVSCNMKQFDFSLSFIFMCVLCVLRFNYTYLEVIPQKWCVFSVHPVRRHITSICPITGDVNTLVKVVSVTLHHCKLIISPLEINKYLMQRYFATISCFSSHFCILLLICIRDSRVFLWWLLCVSMYISFMFYCISCIIKVFPVLFGAQKFITLDSTGSQILLSYHLHLPPHHYAFLYVSLPESLCFIFLS